MIKANTTIISGGKTYKAGQTITGLSSIDKEWMKKAGYITETSGKKEAVEQLAQTAEAAANEL